MFFQMILNCMQAEYKISNPTWLLVLSVTLAILPILICLFTSFVKLSVVLGILKNALGTQHAPSGMVTMALSLSLSMLIMNPIVNESLELGKNIQIEKLSMAKSSEILDSLLPLLQPWKGFLQKNTGQRELAMLAQVATSTDKHSSQQRNSEFLFLIPAFLLSELKEGFCLAFILLVPFLLVDLIVANILMGLGMMMLSPVVISLPIKLILFVCSDAWILVSQALIKSYGS